MIAGSVVGVLVLCCLAGGFFWWRNKKKVREPYYNSAAAGIAGSPAVGGTRVKSAVLSPYEKWMQNQEAKIAGTMQPNFAPKYDTKAVNMEGNKAKKFEEHVQEHNPAMFARIVHGVRKSIDSLRASLTEDFAMHNLYGGKETENFVGGPMSMNLEKVNAPTSASTEVPFNTTNPMTRPVSMAAAGRPGSFAYQGENPLAALPSVEMKQMTKAGGHFTGANPLAGSTHNPLLGTGAPLGGPIRPQDRHGLNYALAGAAGAAGAAAASVAASNDDYDYDAAINDNVAGGSTHNPLTAAVAQPVPPPPKPAPRTKTNDVPSSPQLHETPKKPLVPRSSMLKTTGLQDAADAAAADPGADAIVEERDSEIERDDDEQDEPPAPLKQDTARRQSWRDIKSAQSVSDPTKPTAATMKRMTVSRNRMSISPGEKSKSGKTLADIMAERRAKE
jgi:hypothetical protein